VVALAVTGDFFGLAFFFVLWCAGVRLGAVVRAGVVVATAVAASLACLAFPPPAAEAMPPMMTSAARLPSTVRTLWRRSHDVRAGRP
jgi:hypothetical protein